MKTFSQLKKLLLIINPVSGRRTSLRFLPDIIRIFSEGDYAVTVFPTGKSGDATQFAQLYGNEFDLIVCIGGDGTFLEVIHRFDFPPMPIIGINTGHLGFFQEIILIQKFLIVRFGCQIGQPG